MPARLNATSSPITFTSAITDLTGGPLPDADSTPDAIDGNGAGESTALVDDAINGDGHNAGDEDDHDLAEITVTPVAVNPALAINKRLNGAGDYRVGETISFTIRITKMMCMNLRLSQRTAPANAW
ncbi:MAG: hypothetical protein R2911_43965 [Caldilineaceae bacterium]